MWIALAWLPKEWLMIVFAFAAFRIMDILKPQPAREVERIPRGWGIMLDDVVAGVYANIAVRLVLLALSQFLPFVRQGG
jgi:phosphatidylglycerophosphatase A